MPPVRILALCTANQCRSPMAEVMLAAKLARRGVDADVRSAGILEGGKPAWPEAVEAVAERGLDLGAHRSRPMEPGLVRDADLVLGMAREHAREAIALEPSAYSRVFTLKELVRAGTRHPRGGEPLDTWLADLADGRAVEDLLGADPADDIGDPIGGPLDAFRATATELDGLLDALLTIAFPSRT